MTKKTDSKNISLQITPNILGPFLSKSEIEKRIMVPDVQLDEGEESDSYYYFINISFGKIPIVKTNPSGSIVRSDDFFACKSAEIDMFFHDPKATIVEHNKPVDIELEVTLKNNKTRKTRLSILPTLPIKNNNIEIASLEYEAGTEVDFITKYKQIESSLKPNIRGRKMEWEISKPTGGNVIRDYLYGNKLLYVKFSTDASLTARLHGRPNQIRIFNSDKSEVGRLAAMVKEFLLVDKEKTKIRDANGFGITFEDKNEKGN
ncbi:MAG: hypothetical protein AAGC64_02740 [Bacteroidota bacterium]